MRLVAGVVLVLIVDYAGKYLSENYSVLSIS